MQRKLGSTVFAIVITLIVVLWLASEPPPASVDAARETALIEQPRSAPDTLEIQGRDALAVPEDAPTIEIEPQEPPPSAPPTWWSTCAPGVVEVLVLLDREPHSGANVRLVLQSKLDEPLEVATDARGLARFGPFEGDLEAQVEASIEPDLRASTGATWHAGKPTSRIVIHFGRGGVEGRVYEVDGFALADAVVQLDLYPEAAGNAWSRSVRTESDGSYRIAGVPHCDASVYAGKPDEPAPRSLHISVAEGQWVRADFGRTGPSARWSGRLLLGSGAQVQGIEQLSLRNIATGEVHVVRCSRPGEFAAEIPPGDYSASVWTARGESVLGDQHIEAGELVRDLIVPGIELWGSLSYSGADSGAERVLRSVQVWVEQVATGRKHLANRPRGDALYALNGLEPGEYVVRTWDQPLLGAGDAGLRVVLDDKLDQVQLDLALTDRR